MFAPLSLFTLIHIWLFFVCFSHQMCQIHLWYQPPQLASHKMATTVRPCILTSHINSIIYRTVCLVRPFKWTVNHREVGMTLPIEGGVLYTTFINLGWVSAILVSVCCFINLACCFYKYVLGHFLCFSQVRIIFWRHKTAQFKNKISLQFKEMSWLHAKIVVTFLLSLSCFSSILCCSVFYLLCFLVLLSSGFQFTVGQ